MAQRTVYTCDNCAAETQDVTEMWGLQICAFNFNDSSNYPSTTKDSQWCRPCTERMHLLPPVKTPVEKLPKPPTFEEMLRAIIREEVEDLTGAAQ